MHYFTIFSYVTYAHIVDQRVKDKGEKCVLLGISEESKNYKLYNPQIKKMIVRREVVFNEK